MWQRFSDGTPDCVGVRYHDRIPFTGISMQLSINTLHYSHCDAQNRTQPRHGLHTHIALPRRLSLLTPVKWYSDVYLRSS